MRREQVEVRTTTLAAEALRWVVGDPVAVLVCDYDMPVMTGAQLAARARAARPETVRVLLTGKGTLESAVDGINQGEIFRFIAKPFTAESIRAEVAAAIERHYELMSFTADRKRRDRHQALRAALESEFPGLTEVHHGIDGAYEVAALSDDDIATLGLAPLLTAVGSR